MTGFWLYHRVKVRHICVLGTYLYIARGTYIHGKSYLEYGINPAAVWNQSQMNSNIS